MYFAVLWRCVWVWEHFLCTAGAPLARRKHHTEVVIGFSAHCPRNSIAFGSAPRREADSQPISQLVRQAVSQTVSQASRQTETPSLVFLSVAGLASCTGEDAFCQNKPQSNGNAADCRLVWRFESRSADCRPRQMSADQESNRRPAH